MGRNNHNEILPKANNHVTGDSVTGNNYSTLAQLEEHAAVNRTVPGSSPGGGAKTMKFG